MALGSLRFAGVPALESCAVDDAFHLVPGVAAGPDVVLVQQALIDLGFSCGERGADGDYGSGTAGAVTRFKTAHGLTGADGLIDPIVGKRTITTLDAAIARFDAGAAAPAVLQTVTFWTNAFIPDPSLSDSVRPAPGASAGGSMVAAPGLTGDRFFLGDHRGFSDDVTAPARIHSIAVITGLDGPVPTLRSATTVCGETVEISVDGDVIGRATAPADRCRFLNLRGNASVDPNGGVIVDDPSPLLVQLDFEAAAGNPLMLGAPDIDLLGVLRIDRAANRIRFVGAVDDFPAFEAYVAVNAGPPMTLFRERPLAPVGLIGDVKRAVDASVGFVPL